MNKPRYIEWIENENGCFICTSHKGTKQGYYNLRRNKRTLKMHRVLYEELFGKIPEGLVIRHKCDNPSCINPEHMELGTQKDNIHDMSKRNRHGRTKLTREQVNDMRKKWKENKYNHYYEIAKEYGVAPATAWRVINEVHWNLQ